MNKFIFLYVTAPNLAASKHLSQKLLSESLVACVNIFPQICSLYKWKGQLKQSRECILVLKTNQKNVKKVCARIEKLHPYDTPCIAQIELKNLNSSYANWLQEQLK